MTDAELAIRDRLERIRATLPPHVRLIAVTKTVPSQVVREAYAAGVRDFGESRIQESWAKQQELQDLPDITWHFIGHLQTNKAKKALSQFHWIHAVDNLKLAQRLNELAASFTLPPKICLQVKLAPDPDKFGWTESQLLADLPLLDQCVHLDIQGLMTIPPLGFSQAETYDIFQRAAALADKISGQDWSHLQMHHLSMGMSEDYSLALRAGATMIRLGRCLFGERHP